MKTLGVVVVEELLIAARWISSVINVEIRKAIRLFILMKCGDIAAVLDCLLVLRQYKCSVFTTLNRRRSYCDQ